MLQSIRRVMKRAETLRLVQIPSFDLGGHTECYPKTIFVTP